MVSEKCNKFKKTFYIDNFQIEYVIDIAIGIQIKVNYTARVNGIITKCWN